MKSNSEIRSEARADLSGKWSSAVMITLIVFVIEEVLTSVLSLWHMFEMFEMTDMVERVSPSPMMFVSRYLLILTMFISIPLSYGYMISFLNNSRGEEFSFKTLFSGFEQYKIVFKTLISVNVKVVLYILLLIVPGVMKFYSYALVPYLMKDRGIYGKEAMNLSEQLMMGNRMRLFKLDLSFIGWSLLVILTFGLAFLWVKPYFNAARVRFYIELIDEIDKANIETQLV